MDNKQKKNKMQDSVLKYENQRSNIYAYKIHTFINKRKQWKIAIYAHNLIRASLASHI